MPTRLPVSISASIINPVKSSLYLTGANATTTPNLFGGAIPNTDFGVLIRDMAHASPYAPVGLGNMNSENYYSGVKEVKIESPNYNTNGYIPLGANVSEMSSADDVAINGGRTSLIHGQIFEQALNANPSGLIKIYVRYFLTDLETNEEFAEEQPMILYHYGECLTTGFYGEIWGRGSYLDLVGNQISQKLEIRMKHMRTPNNASSNSVSGAFQTYIEQEGPLGAPTNATMYDTGTNLFHNSLGDTSSPVTLPAQANSLNGQILPFGNTFSEASTAGSICTAPTASVQVVNAIAPDLEPNNNADTTYFNEIAAGKQFGVCFWGGNPKTGFNTEALGPDYHQSPLPGTVDNGVENLSNSVEAGQFMGYTYFRIGAIDTEFIETNIPGCTDPLACNYDPGATVNDGSCSFAENNYLLVNTTTTNTSEAIYDTTVPGQTTVSGFSAGVAWGTFTAQPGTYNADFTAAGNPTAELFISINNGVYFVAFSEVVTPSQSTASGDLFNVNTGANAEITLQAGDTMSWYWAVTPVNSTCYSPKTSATLNVTAPNNQVAGCTSSTAYNYNSAATLDDGSCLYCTTSADVVEGFFPLESIPSTDQNTANASASFNIIPGSSFGTGSLGTLHVIQHADSSAAISSENVTSYLQTGVAPASMINIQTIPFNGVGGGQSVSQFTIENLEGGKVFTVLVEVDGGYGLNSTCFFQSNFGTQYFDCTDPISVNQIIYTNFNSPVYIGSSGQFQANVSNETLCEFTTDCNIINPTVDIEFGTSTGSTPNNCENVVTIFWTGAIGGLNTILTLSTPQGVVDTIFSPSGGSAGTISSEEGFITRDITGSTGEAVLGSYIANLYVTSSDGSLSCVESDTLTVQQADVSVCGCTDSNAFNYDPLATQDDGSCTFSGCTDPEAFNFVGFENANSAVDCTGAYIPDIFGAGNSLADNSCCIYNLYGCTDSTATNYNPEATDDDGTCIYPVILGCTDNQQGVLNYNPLANLDDGTCEYTGCTDVNASNPTYYTVGDIEVLANIDNGTCFYNQGQVPGCTDIAADNYNPDATVNVGCVYDGVEGGDGPTPTITLVVPNYNDLIDILDICVSKAIHSYYIKLITGQKCDKTRVLHLTIVKHLLDNRGIKCLFDGSANSINKLNKLITFALSVCDDCELDIADITSTGLAGSIETIVPTNVDFLQGADGAYVQEANGNLFIETNTNFNII